MNRRQRSLYPIYQSPPQYYCIYPTPSTLRHSIPFMQRNGIPRHLSNFPFHFSYSMNGNNHGIARYKENELKNSPFQISMVPDIPEDYIGPAVTSFGIICLFLNHKIRADISIDRSIRLINNISRCSGAMDSKGSKSVIFHPTGSIYQNNSNAQIQTATGRYGKLCPKGITFTCETSPLVYLVDEGGVKTTVDKFMTFNQDLPVDVFYENCKYGPKYVSECLAMLQKIECKQGNNGETIWMINGIKITEINDGDVLVSKDQGRKTLKTSISRGNIALQTPIIYACASSPPDAHIFIRRGIKRIHANDRDFIVRNGSRSAGLNESGRVTVQ